MSDSYKQEVKKLKSIDIGSRTMGAMRFDTAGSHFANKNFDGADINTSNIPFAE